MVTPAQAGAYNACRPIQTHVMGTSLRWCDGVFVERVGLGMMGDEIHTPPSTQNLRLRVAQCFAQSLQTPLDAV